MYQAFNEEVMIANEQEEIRVSRFKKNQLETMEKINCMSYKCRDREKIR